ncbi:sensor histidine kinase, partial [Candidatus Peregrinibacteria bacterium]|nr:sensor histidine kinase [Candidatus Peregrinibacteria bacterium]
AGVQFEQIISIFLENAYKYTNKGEIIVNVKINDNSMKCSVTDTGIGISNRHKNKIFDRFTRSKKNKKSGLGIGLYIAKELTIKLNGNIKVKDNPKQKGSVFIIELPVYKKIPKSI